MPRAPTAVFLGEIKEAARHARDDADVVRAKLGPSAVAARLLDGLVKLGVGHAVLLAFDDGVRLLALVIAEDNQIRAVARRAVGCLRTATIRCRHRLLFAFAGEFGVAVGDGAFEVAHSESFFSVACRRVNDQAPIAKLGVARPARTGVNLRMGAGQLWLSPPPKPLVERSILGFQVCRNRTLRLFPRQGFQRDYLQDLLSRNG